MKVSLGSISHGTMRNEDLIPTFAEELKRLDTDKQFSDLIEECQNFSDYDQEKQDYLLNESLFNALNYFSPSYCYFGSHHGDGSDYGFWVSEDVSEYFEGLKVSDTSEIPEDYQGEVLFINDHGNCTLYSSDNGKNTEIWSIV